MKRLRLFESFSKEEWQKEIMDASNMLDILYDLKEVSLEYLDIRHKAVNDEDEDVVLEKKVIFVVDLYDREDGYLANLAGGQYSLEDTDIEGNLYWPDEITAPAEEIVAGFKSEKLYLNITFCIVVGEDGDLQTVNEDTSNALERISSMYPEVEFDTFDPWDLN